MKIQLLLSSILAMSSFAQAAPSNLVLEAESMEIKTSGMPITGYQYPLPGLAQSETVWALFSNADVGSFIEVSEEGTYQLQVQAFGHGASATVKPKLLLKLDDLPQSIQALEGDTFRTYSYSLVLKPGVHKISFRYINDDQSTATQDINAVLNRVTILSPAQVALSPRLVSQNQWTRNLEAIDDELMDPVAMNQRIDQYRKGNAAFSIVDSKGKAVSGLTINVKQTQHEFLFGANFCGYKTFGTTQKNTKYETAFKDLFNYATVCTYWKYYNEAAVKSQLTWLNSQGMQVKAHPVLWGESDGFKPGSSTPPTLDEQRARVIELMSKPEFQAIKNWEVVNEPSMAPYRDAVPIDASYKLAQSLRPDANLIINDYNNFSDPDYRFYQLLSEAQSAPRNVPFQTVGMQTHDLLLAPFDSMGAVANGMFDFYQSLGKSIQATEFIPRSGGETYGVQWTPEQQRAFAEKFYRIAFAHPGVKAVTWWDFADRPPEQMWAPYGGMLDQNLDPKPVYTMLKNLIKNEWNTSYSRSGSGNFTMRGFYGTYTVTVTNAAKKVKTYTVKIQSGQANSFKLTY